MNRRRYIVLYQPRKGALNMSRSRDPLHDGEHVAKSEESCTIDAATVVVIGRGDFVKTLEDFPGGGGILVL